MSGGLPQAEAGGRQRRWWSHRAALLLETGEAAGPDGRDDGRTTAATPSATPEPFPKEALLLLHVVWCEFARYNLLRQGGVMAASSGGAVREGRSLTAASGPELSTGRGQRWGSKGGGRQRARQYASSCQGPLTPSPTGHSTAHRTMALTFDDRHGRTTVEVALPELAESWPRLCLCGDNKLSSLPPATPHNPHSCCYRSHPGGRMLLSRPAR